MLLNGIEDPVFVLGEQVGHFLHILVGINDQDWGRESVARVAAATTVPVPRAVFVMAILGKEPVLVEVVKFAQILNRDDGFL